MRNLPDIEGGNRDVFASSMTVPRQKINMSPVAVTSLQNQVQQIKISGETLPSSAVTPQVAIQRIPITKTTQQVRAQFFVNPADPNFKPVSVFTTVSNRTIQLQAIGNKSPVVFGGTASVVPSSFVASQVGSSGAPIQTGIGGGISGGSNRSNLG